MTSTNMTLRTLPSDQDASGRTLGEEEIAAVSEALHSGTLTSTKGRFTKQLEKEFAEMLGAKYAFACASGSAAIHCAIAALDLEPGDEVITTPITDMGALAPILFQGAIPVFADVDPQTLSVTAETIAAVASEKTKAIVVTHLFGVPCEMDPILTFARGRKIPVIEDCAQAFLATYNKAYVGTIGEIGCFSLQQGKHITTGEGGLVVTNDEKLARRIFLFINKAWGYGDANPDHYFLALNYRISELQGAVALAQLQKLKDVVERRRRLANILTKWLASVPGISTPIPAENTNPVYWKYAVRIDRNVYTGGPQAFAALLKNHNIFTAPRYIQKPAFDCAIFRDQKTFGESRWPFTLARPEAVTYDRDRYHGAYEGLEDVLVIPWNDRFTMNDIEYIAESLITSAKRLREQETSAA